jgi:hypothetical protein
MNGRIQELVNQADIKFDVSSDNYSVDTATVTPYDLEKFAELIVLHCSSICESIGEQAEITNKGEMARKTKTTAENCAKMIKMSFGIT